MNSSVHSQRNTIYRIRVTWCIKFPAALRSTEDEAWMYLPLFPAFWFCLMCTTVPADSLHTESEAWVVDRDALLLTTQADNTLWREDTCVLARSIHTEASAVGGSQMLFQGSEGEAEAAGSSCQGQGSAPKPLPLLHYSGILWKNSKTRCASSW